MVKGKKTKLTPSQKNSGNKRTSTDDIINIFKKGMNFENTIEYIESKILDAFFGHISRQGEWDLAKQYLLNVKEWCQMLQTTVNFEFTFLPKDLQDKITKIGSELENGIDGLINAISNRNFDIANKELEKTLRMIRELYKIRE